MIQAQNKPLEATKTKKGRTTKVMAFRVKFAHAKAIEQAAYNRGQSVCSYVADALIEKLETP